MPPQYMAEGGMPDMETISRVNAKGMQSPLTVFDYLRGGRMMAEGGPPEEEWSPWKGSASGDIKASSMGDTYPITTIGRGLPGGGVGYQAVNLHDPAGWQNSKMPIRGKAQHTRADVEMLLKLLLSRGRKFAEGGEVDDYSAAPWVRANMNFGRSIPFGDQVEDTGNLNRGGFEAASKLALARDAARREKLSNARSTMLSQVPNALKYTPMRLMDSGASALKGATAGALGMPGDIESMIPMLANLAGGDFDEGSTLFPTSADMEKRLPDAGPRASQRFQDLGEFAGGFAPVGYALKIAKMLMRNPKLLGAVGSSLAPSQLGAGEQKRPQSIRDLIAPQGGIRG